MPEKTITIGLSEEEFQKLEAIKEEYGLTWRGLLLRGVQPKLSERIEKTLERMVNEGQI